MGYWYASGHGEFDLLIGRGGWSWCVSMPGKGGDHGDKRKGGEREGKDGKGRREEESAVT